MFCSGLALQMVFVFSPQGAASQLPALQTPQASQARSVDDVQGALSNSVEVQLDSGTTLNERGAEQQRCEESSGDWDR